MTLSRSRSVLGGVAAVALVAVVLGHAGMGWLAGGGLGIDVLLVLAGYLVTVALLDEVDRTGRVALLTCYRRAGAVLVPGLLVVLAVVGATAALTGTAEPIGTYLEHLWPVALVALVVVVWPIVVVAGTRRGGRPRVLRVARTLAMASAALMIVLAVVYEVPGSEATSRVAFGPDTRLTGLMLGAALATVRIPDRAVPPAPPAVRRPWDRIGGLAVGGLITVFVVVPEFSWVAFRGGIAVVAMLGVAVLAAVTAPSARIGAALARVPLLAWIGARAYAIYLWHWPVLVVRDDLPVDGAAATALALVATVVLAEVTHRYVERPIRAGALSRIVAVVGVGATVVVAVGVVTAPPVDGPTTTQEVASEVEPEPPPVDCTVARCVALTFDDGPGPHTERLLDVLAQMRVTATFFMLGKQVEQFPDVARRAHEAGHEIGSHTFDHDDLVTLGPTAADDEIRAGMTALTEATGVPPTLFRPPYGSSDATVRELLGAQGLTEILWDVDTLDWKHRDAADAAARVLDEVGAGSIVLMHDTRPTTVDAVPGIVFRLRVAGYTLVPVGTLLNGVLEPGATYSSQPGVEVPQVSQ